MRFGRPVLAVIFSAGLAVISVAQETDKAPPPLQYRLVKFEVGEQLGCPMQITIERQSTQGPEAGLRVRNVSTKPIRAYAIVIKVDPRDYVWTNDIGSYTRLGPGQSHAQPVTIIFPNQNKGGVATLMFDYIEFSDGTTWGPDTFQKSKDITAYREARKIAITNLMTLLHGQETADFQSELDLQPFYIGEPILTTEELSHKVNFTNKGYQSVISMLGHMKTHSEANAELAKKLQAMQKPSPPSPNLKP